MRYTPPLTVTSRLIDLVSRISEIMGRWEAEDRAVSPKLRRENRIRTIHSSLAIGNKTGFIHPFADGNGRIGRLWQTVILTSWKPQLAFLRGLDTCSAAHRSEPITTAHMPALLLRLVS